MDDSDDSGVLTNAAVRRRRLIQLSEREDVGGLKAVAKKAGVSAQNLDHVVKRRKQSTARADGSQPPVGMGDQVARKIEAAYGLTPGWMDWPFEDVDFDKYFQLPATQRFLVQGRMIAAIEDAIRKIPSPALEQVDRPPVSNKKVEQHYKLSKATAAAAFLRASTSTRVRQPNPVEPELPLFPPDQEE